MKSLILLNLLCFSYVVAFSQDSSFLLKNYKYRTPGFRALNVNIALSGAAYDVNDQVQEKRKEKSFQLDLSSLSYYRIISTDKRIYTSSVYWSPALGSYSKTVDGNTFNSSGSRSHFSWNFDNRFYRNK